MTDKGEITTDGHEFKIERGELSVDGSFGDPPQEDLGASITFRQIHPKSFTIYFSYRGKYKTMGRFLTIDNAQAKQLIQYLERHT